MFNALQNWLLSEAPEAPKKKNTSDDKTARNKADNSRSSSGGNIGNNDNNGVIKGSNAKTSPTTEAIIVSTGTSKLSAGLVSAGPRPPLCPHCKTASQLTQVSRSTNKGRFYFRYREC